MIHTLKNPEDLRKAISAVAPTTKPDPVKVLFVPPHLTDANKSQFIEVYSVLVGLKFEAVVIIEDTPRLLEKRISMPDLDEFLSVFGPVAAHDGIRNEFADEDDDLYVDNGGVHDNMAIFHQLPFLQAVLDDFQVVSVQLYEQERPSIIKELAYVIEEILGERSALVVVCCELDADSTDVFNRLNNYIAFKDISNIFNTLNSGDVPMKGHCPFIAGVIVCWDWDLGIQFLDEASFKPGQSLVTGSAKLQLKTAN